MASKLFRIFISSTFDDMQLERAALARDVIPALESLCRSHNTQLQVIDLRWGVSPEAVLAQRARRICLEEIARCQAVSPRPNFVALVGQRYGFCPLPDSIRPDVITGLKELVSDNDPRLRLLCDWYVLDRNAVPHEHVLRERQGRYTNEELWYAEVVAPIQSLLRDGVRVLPWTEDVCVPLVGSLTHQEIYAGILNPNLAQPGAAFSYLRTLTDLSGHPKESTFGNLTPSGEFDNFAAAQIANLQTRLATHPRVPHRSYEIGLDSYENNTDYLNRLCRDVVKDLSQILETRFPRQKTKRRLDSDRIAHGRRLRQLAAHFIGRQPLAQQLMKELTDKRTRVLHILGPEGCGKTALLAHAATKMQKEPSRPLVVIRFAGLTPATVSMKGVLKSVIRELSLAAGRPPVQNMPDDIYDLFDELKGMVEAHKTRLIYLFIDDAEKLGFPESLFDDDLRNYSNLKLCLSFTIEHSITNPNVDEDNSRRRVLWIPRLGQSDARLLLESWLANKSRTLAPDQSQQILQSFESSGSPQWLLMVSRLAATLHSFDEVPALGTTLLEIVQKVLGLLTDPRSLGQTLVLRTLAYLTCSRFGLTESEVISLLEDDADVMAAVRSKVRHQLPRIAGRECIPTAIWSRLLFEIAPFLATTQPLRMPVLKTENRILEQVVFMELLPETPRETFHQRLAQYFEQWEAPNTDDRRVSDERAATELLFQEIASHRWSRVTHFLCMPEYIAAKVRHFELAGMLQDFELASTSGGDKAIAADTIRHGKELILYLGSYKPRTIEDHEAFCETWMEGEYRNPQLPDLSRSPLLERTAELLAGVLDDFSPRFGLWQALYLARDRDLFALQECFKCPCGVQPELIAMPMLAFHIKKYPVTVEEFARCCSYYASPWKELGERIPATGMNWREAAYYALIHGGRLPSVTEWMIAAGALKHQTFPWGNEVVEGACNSAEAGLGHPTPVDAFDSIGASPYGVCDLVGNVWEFTSSTFPTLREAILEADFKSIEQPAIMGGYYETRLQPSHHTLGSTLMEEVNYRDLPPATTKLGIDLFRDGFGVFKMDMCLFDVGSNIIGFRYVVEFGITDYAEHWEEISDAYRNMLHGADLASLTIDGLICRQCRRNTHPNAALALATSATPPAILCYSCVTSVLKSLREYAGRIGDGRLFYGHALMPFTATLRNVSFPRLSQVRTLSPNAPDRLVLETFDLLKGE